MLAFRHPLTREVAYGTQLADQRAATHAAAARAMIELEPERHDELAALIADHMEQGGETLRSRALVRPRRATGRATAARATRCASGSEVTELADQLEEDEESDALGVASRLLQLEYAWRLGMDLRGAGAAARPRRRRSRPRAATCTRWRC